MVWECEEGSTSITVNNKASNLVSFPGPTPGGGAWERGYRQLSYQHRHKKSYLNFLPLVCCSPMSPSQVATEKRMAFILGTVWTQDFNTTHNTCIYSLL